MSFHLELANFFGDNVEGDRGVQEVCSTTGEKHTFEYAHLELANFFGDNVEGDRGVQEVCSTTGEKHTFEYAHSGAASTSRPIASRIRTIR